MSNQPSFEATGLAPWSVTLEETLPKSFEAELVEDIMSLVASTSSKIYGKRSAENRKKKQDETNKIN
jgi:predicted site-specific integrase-resolvase